MAKYSIEDTTLSNIADAIRTETVGFGYESRQYTPENMPVCIGDICHQREEEGFKNGKKSQYDEFWDGFQDYGNTRNYDYAFAYSNWNDKSYNPKYPIVIKSGKYTFEQSAITDTKVPIDFTEATGTTFFFRNAKIVTIRELIVNENTSISGGFGNLADLENVEKITGYFAKNLGFSGCSKLTDKSVDVIIGSLKTLTESDGARTLTLHSTVKENLTETQIAIITTQKGWTLA